MRELDEQGRVQGRLALLNGHGHDVGRISHRQGGKKQGLRAYVAREWKKTHEYTSRR